MYVISRTWRLLWFSVEVNTVHCQSPVFLLLLFKCNLYYRIFRTTSRTRVLAAPPLFWPKIWEKFLEKSHLSISRTFLLCFRVYRILTDDEGIGKRAAWRNRRKITQRLYVHLHLICHMSVYNCLPVLKSTTAALHYFNSKYCTI